MKITVKECLELDCFKSGTILAGQQNIDARVRSVSVMDAQDADDAVTGNGRSGQMVLTSFAGLETDDKAKAEIVSALAEAGISVIVVFSQNGADSVGEETINSAEKARLPLILMPKSADVTYTEVIEQIMDELRYGDNFKNNLINNTIYHLLDFEKHSSFQAALKAAAVQNEFQVVLLSRDFNPILTVETRHQAKISDVIRMGKERELDKGGIYTLVDVNGVLTYWGPITINDESYFIFIVDNEDNYSAAEISKLAEIIELAMGMWKYTPQRDIKAELIKALVRDNKSLAYSLKDEMGLNADNILAVFYARDLEPKHGNSVIAEFEKKSAIEVLRVTDREEIYGIIIRTDEGEGKDRSQSKLSCIELFDRLKEGSKTVRIFHATGISGIEGAGDAFKLISETWTFVENVFPYKRVFTRYELALVSNCINLQVTGGHLKKVYMDLFEPFYREMGENKARQLLDTLETFVLDAGMNSSKTSVFMGIHTNTVQYRLKRINEVLGAEITGNRVIPGLTMALALKRLEGVVK